MRPIRGVWLPATNSPVLYAKQHTIDAIARIKDAGFNTIFPNVWWQGYTLYPSAVMASRFGTAIKAEFQGRDPLADVINAARAAGLTIVPWFEYGFIASYQAQGGHILAQYPHWAARDRDRQLLPDRFDWMNGLHPEVQEFILSLIVEVVETYDVDGIQGDDHLSVPIHSGYDAATVAAYRQGWGADPPTNPHHRGWMRWRADRLTDFMRQVYHTIKAINPNLAVSMAPSEYPFSYRNFLVDYPDWLRQGIVDWVHPQLYHSGVWGYRSSANNAKSHLRPEDRAKVFPGMALEPNGRRFSAKDFWSCITYNRRLGFRGECVWVYEQLRTNDDEIMTYLQQQTYGDPAAHVLMRQGMKGNDVKAIQRHLERWGFSAGPLDGVFGRRTAAQVRAFQRANGLGADGIVGPKTYRALTG